ncbi:GAF and ANTAR domain-containing protein [Kibdelosporangium phytohabitans]|uniref:Transcriptional regulator n=1 Tax=Kibdelosporangium phytohabitans TaxID=860235 RepID=A0A0N9HXZ5_9PSEU|nr:GAF and ANTAR domain-containing protein [Kibdelosporangium phytohabitans]ALG06976.1 transcriptional regulator [Kibdelosporangium phytohabitans]MBE1468259.1 transcriptional regulator with GAF, ATPase, and Fis domain [Kibdelosporangium phytohabitans]
MTTSPSSAQREARLLRAFVEMADTLVDDYDVIDLMHQLVDHCVDLLDADAAGLMLVNQRGGLRLLAWSNERTRQLELIQIQQGEGPCLDCVNSGEPVLIADLRTTGDRWPQFTPEALRAGIASVHAIPLRLRRDTIGALNLFGLRPNPLPPEHVRVARALADTATIGILQERAIHRGEVLTEQLQTALNNRVAIEQAKGIISYAANLDIDEAFHALRTYSRNNNIRLSDIANQLVTGRLQPDAVLASPPTPSDEGRPPA